MNFEDLVLSAKSCTLCQDLPLGPAPLFKISPDARILIAGQAPGRVTHERGRPFDDVSGDRLRDWMGIDRTTFYDDPKIAIVPMGFCYPGTGKSGDLPPRPECATKWRAQFMAAMGPLDLVLVMGRYAIDWHLPSAQKLSVVDAAKLGGADGKIFVLPHPSPRNNRWLRQNPWFEQVKIPKIRTLISGILSG